MRLLVPILVETVNELIRNKLIELKTSKPDEIKNITQIKGWSGRWFRWVGQVSRTGLVQVLKLNFV